MFSQQRTCQQKQRPTKELLDEVLPSNCTGSKTTAPIAIVIDSTAVSSYNSPSNHILSTSSSILKRYEDVIEKNQGTTTTSPDPNLPISQGFSVLLPQEEDKQIRDVR